MSYSHLSLKERYCIYHFNLRNYSKSYIGDFIGRHKSTVYRELNRNRESAEVYWYESAEKYACERKSLARTEKRLSHKPLREIVLNALGDGLSPEIISGRLKREYRSEKMRISPEAIYQWVYVEANQGGVLFKTLVRHHKKCRKQRHNKERVRFEGRVSIEKRPKIVTDKKRFGDWESDTMEGGKGQGGLATHVERKSRFLVAGKLKDKTSKAFMDTTIALFTVIKPVFIKTYTTDNGSEFAQFKRLEEATKSRVYFADPYSPWQRGLNENTNGLLRRFFPKGCNFHEISDSLVAQVVDKLNHRPRKCLKYRTPYEVFFKTKTVALRS